MIDYESTEHHPAIEEIVDVLCKKTQNTDRGFFRVEVAYFLAKVAGSMRATIVTKDRGEIPVNCYVLALGASGYGKGFSVSIVENEILDGFRARFMHETLPVIAEKHIWELANDEAARKGTEPEDAFNALNAAYTRAGAYPFTFDSGTTPAVKQLREKLLLANCGAINLQIDEVGHNLLNNVEVLTAFLELYDQGRIKQKLVKNTAENIRNHDIDGKTPTNMLLFGTPNKLFDGSQTEDQFYSFLETGYARRCIFGYGHKNQKAAHVLTAAEIYNNLINPDNHQTITKWHDIMTDLADPNKYGWRVDVDSPEAIQLIAYKIDCEKKADLLPEHCDIQKAELSHRYFKALKLAGAFAFVDGLSTLTMTHLAQAIKLVEESGKAFEIILNREKSYEKLAKYIAAVASEVTHADLHEALPFYRKGSGARNELMTLAMAWGYKQHILIKKTFIDGIEFFQGDTLEETDINEIMLSYSDDWAYGYQTDKAPFDKLHLLTQAPNMHWCNHSFVNQHRQEKNVIPGFNTLALDVDGTTSLEAVHELLKEYTYMTYTTKRHTEEANRFRLIIPMNYILKLDEEEYREFMDNIIAWLPFETDASANQRARKWSTHDGGEYYYNHGQILDVLKFIPKTSKNEQYRQGLKAIESYDSLERWFAERIAAGNRNNQMIKFAFALVDSGLPLIDVESKVNSFNGKLENPLSNQEINSTIMTSVAKRYA